MCGVALKCAYISVDVPWGYIFDACRPFAAEVHCAIRAREIDWICTLLEARQMRLAFCAV